MSEVSGAVPGHRGLKVVTRNCVPNETICEQVVYSQALDVKWLEFCRPHDRRAVIVSAGPSWRDHIDEIRAHRAAGDRIFTVKHAHDGLIEAGIVPDGCFLLDPRPHVADFIENPHPETAYIVATMVHRSTFDRLIERKARILAYHALVGAGEQKIANKGLFISGGSSSATRGLPILKVMGFRKYTLYGFDSCFFDGASRKDGMKVEISGRHFDSTAELVAQSQDFQKLVKEFMHGCTFDVRGPGMIPHVWSIMDHHAANAEYEDLIA